MELNHASRTNIRDALKAPICKELIFVYHSKLPTRWCFGVVADPAYNPKTTVLINQLPYKWDL